MYKPIFIVFVFMTSLALANTSKKVCKNKNGTLIELHQTMNKMSLLSLQVKDIIFHTEDDAEIQCEFNLSGGPSYICDLGNGYKASVFPNSYAPHSGVIVYRYGREVDHDLGLQCKLQS